MRWIEEVKKHLRKMGVEIELAVDRKHRVTGWQGQRPARFSVATKIKVF